MDKKTKLLGELGIKKLKKGEEVHQDTIDELTTGKPDDGPEVCDE